MATDPRPAPSEAEPERPPAEAKARPTTEAAQKDAAPRIKGLDLRVRSLQHEHDASGGH